MYELRLTEQNQLLSKQEQEIHDLQNEINKQSAPLYQLEQIIKPGIEEEEIKLEDINPKIKSEEKYRVKEETEDKSHTRSQGPPIMQKEIINLSYDEKCNIL